MEPQSSKLQHRQQEEAIAQQQQQSEQKTTAHEFQTAEEMLRADAAQTAVPEVVKTRLADSVSQEPGQAKPRSWWQRLLP
jgi:hypothetical protein